ncbi:hypothetical protein NMS78_003570 [Vibrio cholerae]|nr:hypothetical protein [Vibrio cholerae]EJL6655781.1 hypothetical protein [Vibrio cholerae]MDF4533410.1 hypothetical protein [Vibrio parahaemolyticus]BCK25989.1 hypothetical protein VCSRO63_2929 [Vibrio cholerae]BCK26057.1 hypothetical protein VCSRO63_2997 [Vibrio cholerae]
MEEKNEGFQETHSDNVESIDGLKENVTKQPFHIRRPKDWKDKSYRQLKDEVRKQFIEQGHDDVSDDVVERIVDDITQNVVKRKRRQRLFSALRFSLLVSLVTFVIAFLLLLSDVNGKYVGKSELQLAIKNTVIKTVPLDDLKVVFLKKQHQ